MNISPGGPVARLRFATLQCIWILYARNKAASITLPDFKLYYQAIVIKKYGMAQKQAHSSVK